MPRIRKIDISNFRGVKSFTWCPSPGINCLIGPGDSGKSTVLDAIDLCMGARRTVQFTDADFFELDVDQLVRITVTIGELNDALKNLDSYGLFLRGFNAATGEVEDEPEVGLETVLTLDLTVGSDLEPVWALVSDRAQAQGANRNLTWGDRQQIAPTRIGAHADFNLSWRRGSVLNQLTDEKPDASAALAKAARDARTAFGADAEDQLGETLKIVGEAASELGIDIGGKARALLDAHSVSFGGGTISLHNESGVPLRGLGIGSARLLIAGLQRKAAGQAPLLLVDELEHGLEPHRIIRFLGSLGAKEAEPPLQVFLTTHSPVALRELSGSQLFVLREFDEAHHALAVGTDDGVQGTIRAYPDAFLARSVIVCEGASEVGLMRGIDQYQAGRGKIPPSAHGCAFLDGNGVDNLVRRAEALRGLRYRSAILRDDDKQPDAAQEQAFVDAGGTLFKWREGRALEDELFLSLPLPGIAALLEKAVDLWGEDFINERLKTASANALTLAMVQADIEMESLGEEQRRILGSASRSNKASWFKSVTLMEEIGREIVGPNAKAADKAFLAILSQILGWVSNA